MSGLQKKGRRKNLEEQTKKCRSRDEKGRKFKIRPGRQTP